MRGALRHTQNSLSLPGRFHFKIEGNLSIYMREVLKMNHSQRKLVFLIEIGEKCFWKDFQSKLLTKLCFPN